MEGKKKANNKARYYKPKQIQNHMPTMMKGFLITCDQNREKRAVSEAYRFLNQYVDTLYEKEIEKILSEPALQKRVKKDLSDEGAVEEETKQNEEDSASNDDNEDENELEKKAESNGGDKGETETKQHESAKKIDIEKDNNENTKIKGDTNPAEERKINSNEETKKSGEPKALKKKQKGGNISAELQKELERNKTANKVLYSFETDCKGVVFIKVNPIFEDVLDVKKVANLAMKDIWDNNKRLARICSRMVPIERATRADLKNYEANIKDMIAKKFNPEKPITWYLQFRCKNNEKFSQKPFLDAIIENIGKTHSVDYKNPQYTIFVEINKHLLCMSILKKFNRFKRYSLKPENIGHPTLPKKLNAGDEAKKGKPGQDSAPKDRDQGESLVARLEFEEQGENKQEIKEEPQKQEESEESDVDLV